MGINFRFSCSERFLFNPFNPLHFHRELTSQLRSSNHEKTYIEPGIDVKLDDKAVVLKPIQSAHVGNIIFILHRLPPFLTLLALDQSEHAAIQRVKHHMGQRADELLKGRFRILK